ncbi:acetoacetate decarboxylase family protein [Nocardia sp. 2]|uniref:Acetoacetate decarboxylase family protein n=1 Tax=Nocardia acididurans TaxID=2802282 RepID=A0ABS1LZT4_9NOCA|nr:acetoacetate decarboxylase family protein [Nocardia acididurans]MBL1073581.1 acetoacetate decarboxylase family protein [Nocardia acididurans]
MAEAHPVQGEQVRMPVEIRHADASSAIFLVDAAAAAELLAPAGLAPLTVLPGKAVCSLAFVRYVDGDLGPYHEFAFSLMARQSGRRDSTGAYIHWLPVNQSFTCEAGQSIWGFPKLMADIDITPVRGGHRCEVRIDGELVVALRISNGLPMPAGAGGASIDAYTHRNGILRRTPWLMDPSQVRGRPGGARVELGTHPVSEQLRALGLPKTALFSSRIGQLRMTFSDATTVLRTREG